MNIANEQILESVGNMTVMQLCDLTRALEEHFGVKAADAVRVAPAPATDKAPTVEEQTEFKVVLSALGENRVRVIKVIREATGASLMDASKLATPGTVIKEALEKSDAEALKAKFLEVGAQVAVQ